MMHQVAAQLVRSNTDGSIDDLLRGMFASEPAAPVVETRIALPTDDAISVTESLVGDEALVHRPSAYLAVGSEAPSDVGTLSRPQQPVAKGFVPEATEGDWSMTESDDDESLVSGPKRMSKAKAKKGKTKAGSSSKAKKATAKVRNDKHRAGWWTGIAVSITVGVVGDGLTRNLTRERKKV